MLNVISRLRITTGTVIGAVRRETPSTAAGARAKALLLAALNDLGNALVSLKREILALAHGNRRSARRHARRALKLLNRGERRERRAFAVLKSANSPNTSQPPPSANPPPSQQPQPTPPPSHPTPTPIIPGLPIFLP